MQVKKQYEAIYAILEANKNRKVSTVLPELIELMQAKRGGSDIGKTFLKTEEGDTYAVYCYYHKQWELVSEAEYGKKANTATGLNTMCKEGVSQWGKQQRNFKKGKDDLLMQVANQELSAEELPALMDELEANRTVIVPREDGHGYEDAEVVRVTYLTDELEELDVGEDLSSSN